MMDQGTDFYKWKYRFDTGKQALGTNSILVGGLTQDQSYYVRLYAYNSVGEDWTGKIFYPYPAKSFELPFGLAMWLDATQISGLGRNQCYTDRRYADFNLGRFVG